MGRALEEFQQGRGVLKNKPLAWLSKMKQALSFLLGETEDTGIS